MATLYVGNLHHSVTERMLEETFRYAGPLHSIHLCRDKITGSSLGYAYVNFQHRADGKSQPNRKRLCLLIYHFVADSNLLV